ncbi:MAG: hypothetical protein AABZ74_11060 [Cyanobacteriota bacterium]
MSKSPLFKYLHKDKLSFTLIQKTTILILVIFAIFFNRIYLPISIGILIFTFIYSLITYPKKTIFLSSRYLICGNTIFYYKNIDKIVLNTNSGILSIYSEDKEVFKLDKNLIPTNARKQHKIDANKNNKFKKLSDKIIDKIKNASPNVELHGVI